MKLTNRQIIISVVLKLVVIISIVVGTILSAIAGIDAFMGVVWWIITLLLLLIGLGFLYIKIVEILKNKKIEKEKIKNENCSKIFYKK